MEGKIVLYTDESANIYADEELQEKATTQEISVVQLDA